MSTQERSHSRRGTGVTVDCYVRADSITDDVEEQFAAIEALSTSGAIDEWAVHPWPAEIVLSPATRDSEPVEQFRTFERWAAQWDVSIEPPFARERRSSAYTGESREVLVTPTVCLAVYANGRLREVFPHSVEGRTYTVDDALDALHDGLPGVEAEPAVPSDDGRCPRCDEGVVNGQGLYACSDCGWSAIATGPGSYRRVEFDDATPSADTGDDPRLFQ